MKNFLNQLPRHVINLMMQNQPAFAIAALFGGSRPICDMVYAAAFEQQNLPVDDQVITVAYLHYTLWFYVIAGAILFGFGLWYLKSSWNVAEEKRGLLVASMTSGLIGLLTGSTALLALHRITNGSLYDTVSYTALVLLAVVMYGIFDAWVLKPLRKL